MSTRYILCTCTTDALHSIIEEFKRQGFHSFEVSVNDYGKLILSGVMGEDIKKLRKPTPKSNPL